MKKLDWGTCIVIVLLIATSDIWAQVYTVKCDRSCMRTMRDLVQTKKTGVGDTFLDRANSRLGDRVADGIAKLFAGHNISKPANIRLYLPIIRDAFEAPGMIQITQNRKPIATLRMLNNVKNNVTDESSRKEIDALIDWLNSLES